MRDNVFVKAYIYILHLKECLRIIMVETYLEDFGNLRCFFLMNPTP
jgi:hypothetical protein